jgi:hypothetical protein
MLDYYKLFDYCKKISEDKNLKKERHKKNRESKQKKQLFRIIIENAYNNIKTSADEGKDCAVIYDSEYNKLIDELLDSLTINFKPFNVIYKKKNIIDRGIFEVLKDESNYILIIDWNVSETKLNNNECVKQTTCNKELNQYIKSTNIDKEINNEINEVNNKEEQINNEINEVNNKEEQINNEINEINELNEINEINELNEINNKKDTFLEKLGFEAIF